MKDITLIAGTPASGKTTFGDYLRDKKHFLHVDIEAFEGSYLHSIWEAALRLNDITIFLSTLRDRSEKTVLTWGFHPNNLNVVHMLQGSGVDLWWFEADENAARQAFKKRGGIDLQCFDDQIARIKAKRNEINKTFSPNIIQTLDANSKWIDFATIFQKIK